VSFEDSIYDVWMVMIYGYVLLFIDSGYGFVVLFIYGLLGLYCNWIYFVDWFDEDYCVIVFDLFGYGMFDKLCGDYLFGVYVVMLCDLFDCFDVE